MSIHLKSLCHNPLGWERHAVVALFLPCDRLPYGNCCVVAHWGLRLHGHGGIQICPDPKSCGMAVRALSENDKEEIKPVDFFLFDITGGVFEYQITEPMGPNSTHSKARCALAGGAVAVGLFVPGFLPNEFVECCRRLCSGPLPGAWLGLCAPKFLLGAQAAAAGCKRTSVSRAATCNGGFRAGAPRGH